MFFRVAVLIRFFVAVAFLGIFSSVAFANNQGDPLFCQPNEGNTFLITNSGTGQFTADPDCYGNFSGGYPTVTTITTSNGGTLTPTLAPSGINYVYTPPSAGFVGLDTFTIGVTTSWNSNGGTGSHGGTSLTRPGAPDTETVTLNVLSSTVALTALKNTAYTVQAPVGSVSGCGTLNTAGFGFPNTGPQPGAVVGCTTAVSNLSPYGTLSGLSPSHGTLTRTGGYSNPGLVYTPNTGFYGIDTFNFFALGVNTDGRTALSSDPITATVTVKTNIDTLNPSYNASLLATFLNPVFTDGTLALDQPGATYSQGFTLSNATTNTIDQTGNAVTFSGVFSDATSGGNLVIANSGAGGSVTFTAVNTYTGTTTINSGATLLLSGSGSIATSSGLVDNGVFDISGTASGASLKSLSGNGAVALGGKTLTLTNANDTFAGTIGGTGGLTIAGGIETLTGANSYNGLTTINSGGTLVVNGSIANATVNTGGVLSGAGQVGATTVNSGGVLAPGAGAPGSSLTVSGNLAFASGAMYLVQLNQSGASFANVTGTASLGGTVLAVMTSGNFRQHYDILHSAGLNGTTFSGVSQAGLLAGVTAALSYSTTDVFLNLTASVGAGAGLNTNRQNVATSVNTFFNSGGALPPGFAPLFGLSGSPLGGALSQVSGEGNTGTQQTTFQAMSLFLGLLTEPFLGRGDGVNGSNTVPGYAAEGANAYAARTRLAAEREAYAMFTKAPLAKSYEPRWSVWASAFGGTQTTSGNATVGSNDTRSSIYGTAVGASYLFSPNTLAGFAIAGGGTGFAVANGLGSGRSDLFQAGAYLRHTNGPAYISAALAYGWQDITTDRVVTVAGLDRLRAQFNANAWSGRVEGGYRFVAPLVGGIGITPYAAAQFTNFQLPSYMEQAVFGTNTFVLGYNAKSVTDSRTEFGLRSDKSLATETGIVTLRGRLAWAHDYNPNRSLLTTFQTLPGASFVVNGAKQAADSALTTASIEWKWGNHWTATAIFEGEYSNVTTSYAGKGSLGYQW